MGLAQQAVQRAQELAPQAKAGLDGLAVASGFAVWADKVPTWVGIFTICWLGYQMVLHLPRLLDAITELKKRFAKKD